jgi:cold shock CspA family protein
VPDDGSPDVLLHVTCLRRDGHQSASEGARIVVRVEPGPGVARVVPERAPSPLPGET